MYHIHSDVIKKIFRKNTKQQIKDQIHIPDPIIETKLLKQNEIENAIYNSVLGDEKKMIQMCSHVSISDENISILGNNPKVKFVCFLNVCQFRGTKTQYN